MSKWYDLFRKKNFQSLYDPEIVSWKANAPNESGEHRMVCLKMVTIQTRAAVYKILNHIIEIELLPTYSLKIAKVTCSKTWT